MKSPSMVAVMEQLCAETFTLAHGGHHLACLCSFTGG